MATPLSDLRAPLKVEIGYPGALWPTTITDEQLDGYLANGFWETKLAGLMTQYRLAEGNDAMFFPTSYTSQAITGYTTDLTPTEAEEMLVVIMAGFRALELKCLEMANNIRAVAGPVQYEAQASATVIRAVLESLRNRLRYYLDLVGDTVAGSGGFVYMDGVAQRTYSLVNGLQAQSILP
jgi:hypothetical protein